MKKKNKNQSVFRYQLAFICLILLLSAFFIYKKDIYRYFSHPRATVSPTSISSEAPLYNDFHLVIPSLKLNAPVIANVDGNNQKTYDQALEKGVAQLSGSTLPGENSNIFIFGHSSYYWWKPGSYKTIFATLPKIKNGDEIDLWYEGKLHKYQVSDIKTVLPSDVSVTAKTSSEQLTLMTCVPVGTDQKRLIVTAKPI